MNINKIIILTLSLIILISSFSGCVGESGQKVHVNYEIKIKNPNQINYSIEIPTLVMGNNKYNTPIKEDLKPVVDPKAYVLKEGALTSELTYNHTVNCTLLNINSNTSDLHLEFKKDYDDDRHKYKNEKYLSICPFLNSYYNQSKFTMKGNDEIGIIYHGSDKINVTINYKMSYGGNDVSVDGTFDVNEEGFQLKPVYFEWRQTP